MDPNASLYALIAAATAGEAEGVMSEAKILADWLRRGGFAPSVAATIPFGLVEPMASIHGAI